jgi:peptidase C25-like protein
VNYEKGIGAGIWDQQVVIIADQNISDDFTTAANSAALDMPASLQVTKILADGLDPNVARQEIVAALNNGALLVNYLGHGSVEQWSFADLFDDSSASVLSNGNQLPVYLIMDCLNGFFQDVYSTSLAESLLLAPNGGAVAVWASSGFTDAAPQASMDQALLLILKAHPTMPLGRAILEAKSGVTNSDVRRTWILFGDPAMNLQIPSVNPSNHN